MSLFFEILVEFGLPVASATVMGVFIYIILKYILDSVIGQVNSIQVTPGDGWQNADAFSRRIARNVQHILILYGLL